MTKYIYIYKNKTYNTFFALTQHEDFHNVSFPIDENVMSEEALTALGITRQVYVKSLEEAQAKKNAELTSEYNRVNIA